MQQFKLMRHPWNGSQLDIVSFSVLLRAGLADVALEYFPTIPVNDIGTEGPDLLLSRKLSL